jgi:hypothetical protein
VVLFFLFLLAHLWCGLSFFFWSICGVVCPSIYGLWLRPWYRQTLLQKLINSTIHPYQLNDNPPLTSTQ